MVRKFQEGGLNAAALDTDTGSSLGGLDPTAMMLMSVFGNFTSPEAQEYSKRILDESMAQGPNPVSKAVEAKKTQSAAVRAALQKARQTLLAQDFNKGDLLLAASAALGQPTRTGSMGESLSNAVAAIRQPLAERRQFSRQRDSALSDLDIAEAGVDEGVTSMEFQIEQLQRQIQGRMQEEALKTLGKTPIGGKNPFAAVVPDSLRALNAKYAPEYLDFVSNGSADAAGGIGALEVAVRELKGGSDVLTGPYVGSMSTLPVIGDAVQDIFFPSGSNVRALIEQTVQRSLRPILGSQFTQQEGERLISRIYNPRSEEKINALRLEWFVKQLKRAYLSKVDLARYYASHNQTLVGYEGTPFYSYTDFIPPPDEELQDEAPINQDPTDQMTDPETKRSLNEGFRISEEEREREMARIQREGRAEGGRVRYQGGGAVRMQEGGAFDEDTSPFEGNEVIVRPNSKQNDDTWFEAALNFLSDHGVEIGTVLGAPMGMAGEALVKGSSKRLATNDAQRRVIAAMERAGIDPSEAAADVKRGRRAGVPQQLMDVDAPGIGVLAERAFQHGGKDATEALDALRERIEGGRDRVDARVNSGLKPDDFFTQEDKFTEATSNQARQKLFQPVYDKYPGIPQDPILTQIIDTPEGQKALNWAMRFYQNTPGKKIGKEDITGMVRKPSLEFYDYVRRGLDKLIATEENKKDDSGFGDVLRDLRKTYVDRLDQLAPKEYKSARMQYAGDLEIRDALKKGRDFRSYEPPELQQMASGMGFYEKNAFRTGMAQDLFEMLDKSSAENYKAAQRLTAPEIMNKVEPFFDNPHAFGVFKDAIEREAELARTGGKILKQGEDARLKGERQRQEPIEYAIKRAGGLRYAISLPGWVLRIYNDLPNMSEKQAKQMIALLQQGNPKEMDNFARTAKRLSRLNAYRWPRRAAAAGVGAALGAAIGNREAQPQPAP
jgi:hypothetical protein